MKEDLKIEHLAPYLPYRLQVYDDYTKDIKWLFGATLSLLNSVQLYDISVEKIHNRRLEEIKPILRPLSDLTKEIEHNGKKFVPLQYLSINIYWYNLEQWKSDHKLMNVEEYNNLLSWHFDVFGLIEKNLAIDINTLNK